MCMIPPIVYKLVKPFRHAGFDMQYSSIIWDISSRKSPHCELIIGYKRNSVFRSISGCYDGFNRYNRALSL